MQIVNSSRGFIDVELGDEFENITVHISGEPVNDYKGFCLYINSIKQIKPFEKALDKVLKIKIARAINKWNVDRKANPPHGYDSSCVRFVDTATFEFV